MHLYPKRACLDGLEMMEIFKLVSYSATPEQWEEWLRVPLEHAAARGNLELFNKLLGAGANGSAGWRGCRDRTLLYAAAVGGNEDVISGLLRVGAQPEVNVVSCSSKRSALYTATILGHEAVARRLVVAGADVDFQDRIDKRPVLIEAIRGGHEQLATDLLIGGANPNSRGGDGGSSPLHLAAKNGLDGIVSTLLLRGADKDARDHDEETPLTWASHRGHLSVVKTLLTAGADASIRTTDSHAALDWAAKQGHGNVIEAIAGHGVDVNIYCDEEFTALHVAARFNQAGAVNALVEAGADVDSMPDGGATPLAIASYFGSCKAMLALLQRGAKVDVRDEEGDTPLHIACVGRREGVEAAVDLLLRWGVDETALNNDGQSPAEMLDSDSYDEEVEFPSTQDEIDRTRLLLARAPADRTWRRRGWLVMCRSREEQARIAIGCGRDSRIESDGPGVADGRQGGEGCMAAKGEQTRIVADHDARTEMSTNVGASGSDSESGTLGGVVALLLGMEPEGVFRTMVSYL